jgi:hypothetical protein
MDAAVNATVPAPARPLSRGRLWTDGFSFAALGFACFPVSVFVPGEEWWVLGVFALAGLALAAWRMKRLFSKGQEEIVSNVFLTFTLAFSIFFLFGPLLHVFGPEDQAAMAREWFPVNAPQAMRLLATNLLGFGLALVAGEVVRWEGMTRALTQRFSRIPSKDLGSMALTFIALGMAFKIFVLYNDLVLARTVSGLYRIGSLMAPAGIFLHVYKSGLRFRFVSLLALTAAAFYSLAGVIEFSKTETFIPMMALMGGILARKVTVVRLVACGATLGAALSVLQPLNLEARNETLRMVSPTYKERLAIFQAAIDGNFAMAERVGAWARLDYTAPQRAAVHLYETGNGGSDFEMLIWPFVPRFLFPGKPIITGASTEFTYKIRGFNSSATAMGVFINGFYNLGWLGLILVSFTVGVILSWFRAVLKAAQQADSVILLCIGLFGHMTAILLSGTYLANFLGPFVTMFYAVLGMYGIIFLLEKRKGAPA